jgi:hypothetical protein
MFKKSFPTVCVILTVAVLLFVVQMIVLAQSTSGSQTDQQIREKIMTVKNNLRSIADANEAYFVDWNKYTRSIGSLTTPIAYIASIPSDPFAKENNTYQSAIVASGKLAFYSIGPDANDDKAKIIYDPTNGLTSTGDIVRESGAPYPPTAPTQSTATSAK